MGLLDTFKKLVSSKEENQFADIIERAAKEITANKAYVWSATPKDIPDTTNTLLALPDKERIKFILSAAKSVHKYFEGRRSYTGSDPEHVKATTAQTLLGHVLKTKLVLDEEDVDALVNGFISYRRGNWANITAWPLGSLLSSVERNFKDSVPPQVKANILLLKEEIQKLNLTDKDTLKLLEKFDTFLFKTEAGSAAVKPTLFMADDRLAEYANEMLLQQPEAEKVVWYKLMQLSQKVSGSKPSSKFLEQSKGLIKELGSDKFKAIVTDWFEFISRLKEIVQTRTYDYGNGRTQDYDVTEFLSAANLDVIKGMVWMCSHFHDTKTLKIIADLCERCFKKIPGQGPTAASVGNACLYTLYKSKGLEGIAHLSRLKLRIKQNNTQNLIEKYLQEAARAEGVTVSEIEDLAVDDYGLVDFKREFDFEGYKAVLNIEGLGDVSINWFRPDNSGLKSAPGVVKEKHAEKLKKIKATAKQIEVSLTAQRDRIDRMFRSAREMSWEYFEKHYFTHGLLSYLTKDIIWQFKSDTDVTNCIFLNGSWTTLKAKEIAPDKSMTVALWHPANARVEEIRSWREFLIEEKIRQPIRQAFREIYLLTDAEVTTRSYSNRMAAHILKQHQFNSLAKMRGWKYSLLGAYDDGRNNEIAELNLPESNLRAEFWVNEVNADNAFNDTGIWHYVSTDQVRFVNLESQQPIELASVPAVIFSEVMRDVDLFVGVASVGNDPTWRDNGGVPAYRDYWQSYSFGDLSEIAKTRKEILESLVPRLKIASVASIKDKFLIVKGKKRTYKIHIGSTNILMEPNDQYLCIVPDRSKKDTTGNVFLPFEGDAGLSVILSKAMLLAEDDKITDTTILTQIDRK